MPILNTPHLLPLAYMSFFTARLSSHAAHDIDRCFIVRPSLTMTVHTVHTLTLFFHLFPQFFFFTLDDVDMLDYVQCFFLFVIFLLIIFLLCFSLSYHFVCHLLLSPLPDVSSVQRKEPIVRELFK